LLAAKLGYLYFDTGVMYRAVTWIALMRGVSISDEAAVTGVAEEVNIAVTRPTADDGRQYTVLADGEDITWDIRRPEVEHEVSPVSAYPGVREALTRQQRRIGQEGRIVMVGRDIGTVVMADADLKIYLTASVQERARRRCLERQRLGQESNYEQVLRDIQRRDRIDSGRKAAPLKAAPDAVTVDTSSMSIADVLECVGRLVEERCQSLAPRGGEAIER
jgi:cytidylate kinase